MYTHQVILLLIKHVQESALSDSFADGTPNCLVADEITFWVAFHDCNERLSVVPGLREFRGHIEQWHVDSINALEAIKPK